MDRLLWVLVVPFTLAGCAARGESPTAPAVGASPPRVRASGGGARTPERSVVLGEMCPTSAAGRAGVRAWFAHRGGWSDRPAEAAAPLGRGDARQFSIFGHDGRRVGLFSVLGLAQTAAGPVAAGGYAGASPCADPARVDRPATEDPACREHRAGCGLALASFGLGAAAPMGEDPEPADVVTGGACVDGDALAVDIDGDGRSERYPLARFVAGDRGQLAEEVSSSDAAGRACAARFALPGLPSPVRMNTFIGFDLLGVIDADGDGRRELVVQQRWAARRVVALYAATAGTGRLERVAEVTASWP